MITAAQMRAGRALLGIDQKRLADLAGVSLPTIQRMEASEGTVRGVVDTLIKGEPYLDTLGLDYLIQVPIVLALCAIAIWTADRRYHLGLVIVHLLYQAWWIWVLFYTHA